MASKFFQAFEKSGTHLGGIVYKAIALQDVEIGECGRASDRVAAIGQKMRKLVIALEGFHHVGTAHDPADRRITAREAFRHG